MTLSWVSAFTCYALNKIRRDSKRAIELLVQFSSLDGSLVEHNEDMNGNWRAIKDTKISIYKF